MKTTSNRLSIAAFILATPVLLITTPSLLAQTERVQLTLLGTHAVEHGSLLLDNLRTDGSLLFSLNGNLLTVTDFANPSEPTMRSQFGVNGGVALEVGNGLAFVATTSQVQIIDVRNASAPALAAIYSDGVASNVYRAALQLMGSTLFLSREFEGDGSTSCIEAIDVSDPRHPVKMGTYTNSSPSGAGGMIGSPLEADRNKLYYSFWERGRGVGVLDASIPGHLKELGRLDLYGGDIGSITEIGNYLYLTTTGDVGWMWSVQIIDVSDATNPRLARRIGYGGAELGLSGVIFVVRGGDFAFLSGQDTNGVSAMHVLDVRNPLLPVVVGRTGSQDVCWASRVLRVRSNRLLWCDPSTIRVYEVSERPAPAQDFTYTTNNGSITITGYIGPGGAVIIPGTINAVPVTSIGDNAFAWCTGLTSVSMPTSVTSIGSRAFFGCTDLTSMTIGISVTNIDWQAFLWCTSLTNVVIPDSMKDIGYGAFSDCTSLTSVTIGSGVTNIGNGAFTFCRSLTTVYFRGDAPLLTPEWDGTVRVFEGDDNATVYYLPGTIGWGTTFGGRPTTLWLPQVVTSDAGFGVRTNQFGFNITWASGRVVVVEASTTLANPVWSLVSTNTLTDGWTYFSDAQWTNYPVRFYRVRQW